MNNFINSFKGHNEDWHNTTSMATRKYVLNRNYNIIGSPIVSQEEHKQDHQVSEIHTRNWIDTSMDAPRGFYQLFHHLE